MRTKEIILILMVFLMFPLVTSLEECQGVMLPSDIPCKITSLMKSKWIYTNDCNSYTVEIFNSTPSLLDSRSLGNYGGSRCNLIFNYSIADTYLLNFSSGDSAIITITEDETQEVYLYIFSLIIFFILVGIGYAKEIAEFVMIAGILAMIIGTVLVIYGFPNLTSVFLKNSVAVIFWGVGAYLILEPAMDFFERWK